MGGELPLLSLAAGVLPEFAPEVIVRAAAAAGFEATGVWFDPDTWDAQVESRVRAALDDTGLIALDIEPIFVTPHGDHGDRLIDAAAAVGARNILTVGRGVGPGPFTERFGELCDRAAPAGMSVCVEFARIFSIGDLPTAQQVVGDAARPNGGILVDNLHLHRAGHSPTDLTDIAADVLPYAQLCDGPAELADTSTAALYQDAVDGRCNLGEGDLAVRDVYLALPADTPISLEVRSADLRSRFTDPTERARSVLESARAALG